MSKTCRMDNTRSRELSKAYRNPSYGMVSD